MYPGGYVEEWVEQLGISLLGILVEIINGGCLLEVFSENCIVYDRKPNCILYFSLYSMQSF